VAEATAGAASGAVWAGGRVVFRSEVETWDEGAAAIMEGGADCWTFSDPTPDAGAAAVMGAWPLPVAFTGAESVAKELGDPMTL
jgi:hypothetical protein